MAIHNMVGVIALTAALVAVFAVPAHANARCPRDTTEYGVWSEKEAMEKLKQLTAQSDACSDEFIEIRSDGYICHKVTLRCVQGDNRGCAAGQTKPTVTAKLPEDFGGKTLRLSKCDKKGLADALDQTYETGSASPLSRFAIQDRPPGMIASMQPLTGGDIIRRALTGAPPEAVQRASSDPALLASLNAGDTRAIQAAAERAGLNEGQIALLTTQQRALAASRETAPPPGPTGLGRFVSTQTYTNGSGGWFTPSPAEWGPASPFDYGQGSAGGDLERSLLPLLAAMAGQSPFSFFRPRQQQEPEAAPAPPDTSSASGAVATMIFQRSEARRGESVPVSWSSVGMRADSCKMYVGTTHDMAQFAQGNEGSRLVAVPEAAENSVLFRISCVSSSGATVQKEQTLPVI